MLKLLALDNTGLDVLDGFARKLQKPVKCGTNPLLVADQPWENGNFQLYGSVVKPADGPFQLWYSTIRKPWWIYLAYATSDDGVNWQRPMLDLFRHKRKQTNILLDRNIHGPAVILDQADPDPARRYKMVAGAAKTDCIYVFTSPDGVRWSNIHLRPQIPIEPDCPMAFFRAADGRYVCFHRMPPWGRRIVRSESWNLVNWSTPRIIMEPGPHDEPRTQFYGMGAAPYGPFEIGTLWLFHITMEPMRNCYMDGWQEAELTFSRQGYAWHRFSPGEPFILHGSGDDWDRGNLQCASQPVYLDDEIRYYYAGTDAYHATHWELLPQRAGLGYASLKPDRFVAWSASARAAQLMARPRPLPEGDLFVNARIRRGGEVRVTLCDEFGKAFPGFTAGQCRPLSGDRTDHRVQWESGRRLGDLAGKLVRLKVEARHADLFSVYATDPDEIAVYHRFREWR